jgi:hypothetical protein
MFALLLVVGCAQVDPGPLTLVASPREATSWFCSWTPHELDLSWVALHARLSDVVAFAVRSQPRVWLHPFPAYGPPSTTIDLLDATPPLPFEPWPRQLMRSASFDADGLLLRALTDRASGATRVVQELVRRQATPNRSEVEERVEFCGRPLGSTHWIIEHIPDERRTLLHRDGVPWGELLAPTEVEGRPGTLGVSGHLGQQTCGLRVTEWSAGRLRAVCFELLSEGEITRTDFGLASRCGSTVWMRSSGQGVTVDWIAPRTADGEVLRTTFSFDPAIIRRSFARPGLKGIGFEFGEVGALVLGGAVGWSALFNAADGFRVLTYRDGLLVGEQEDGQVPEQLRYTPDSALDWTMLERRPVTDPESPWETTLRRRFTRD